jgi:hypothetical protein
LTAPKGPKDIDGDGRPPIRSVPRPPAEEKDLRAHISVSSDIERMTERAIGTLATDDRVYQRGGMLVGVVTVPEGPTKLVRGIKRAPGSHVIKVLEPASVRERMASTARWTKWNERRREEAGCFPPEAVVGALMARGEWGGVRLLVSVATSPQLRPDGSVLQTPGFDAETGILYWPGEPFPEVAERPTIDDARGALSALRDVVHNDDGRGFPFARPEHESAWLAGLLTMLARPAIDGPVPLFAVDATTAGTGKSRLVDAATRIAYGHDAARTSMPEDDDEMRKRITAIVLEGDPAVCVDNIRHVVNLPSLEAVLTSVTWKDRMLGANRLVSAPHRTCWWLTANNVAFTGDLGRRTLHVRLESKLEKPEERPESDFRHRGLLRWLDGERRRMVAAALTLLRAFHLAGRPAPSIVPWGSFEAWTELVPAALVWAGAHNPMLAKASQAEAVDDEKQQLRTMLSDLARLQGDGSLSARDIVDAVFPERHPGEPAPKDGYDNLRDTLLAISRGRAADARRIGKYFERVRGRVLGGMRLVRGPESDHTATWRVERVT